MFKKIIDFISNYIIKKNNKEDLYLENLQKNINNIEKNNIKLRPTQLEIINFLFQSHNSISFIEAPPGTGKTLAYLVYALSLDIPIIISTFSKTLQKQIQEDCSILDVKPTVLYGKSNYICLDKTETISDEEKNILFSIKPKHLIEKCRISSYYCSKNYRQNHCQFFKNNQCEYFQILNSILTKQNKIIIINHHLIPFITSIFNESDYLLIIDEAHLLPTEQKIYIKEEDFTEPIPPDPKDYNNIRTYNLKLEQYLIQKKKFDMIKKLNISAPGKHSIPCNLNFQNVPKLIFVSATLPNSLISQFEPEKVSTFTLDDNRNWENVKIIIKNTNYKMHNYIKSIKTTVDKLQKYYDKIIFLCTSYFQIELLKRLFPNMLTVKDMNPSLLIKKLLNCEINMIAGVDLFWTGINIPGKKAIVMMKLPFPAPSDTSDTDEEISQNYITAFNEMFFKFKQGIGRMLRSAECSGEIVIFDNRVEKYEELMNYLKSLKEKGAKIEFEKDIEKDKEGRNSICEKKLYVVK